VVSVDATCTSLNDYKNMSAESVLKSQNSMCAWGPTGLLPVFQLLGVDYEKCNITSSYLDEQKTYDLFTKIDFRYKNAIASVKVGKGVKSEGELIISGTKGYIYVPAPWWKTDYFEIRYENQNENQRCFYQLDGEGIRNELIAFLKSIKYGKSLSIINYEITEAIVGIMEDFNCKSNVEEFVIGSV